MTNQISYLFETNRVNFLNASNNISEMAWDKHPKFEGVFLKHMVTGSDTNGVLSYHLVKVEPNCKIGEHIHEGKLEIDEVIQGNGTCTLAGSEFPYSVGSVSVLPADMAHKVSAGKDGLFILAKFSPALL
jgi:quercetin dioxygenase-like cupin family protein